MSDKTSASYEFEQWMNNIGLSGPVQGHMEFDEIPGFVNSNVFGRFSLDDLDFGDDLTKGKIDFDDEYLLMSASFDSGKASRGSETNVHGSSTGDEHHTHSAPRAVRDNYPKRDSSGGYYHPPYSTQKSAARAVSEEKNAPAQGTYGAAVRQMPKDGRSIQENVFGEIEGLARELNIDSKFIDRAKTFMDKAPTRRKLREEEKKAARTSGTAKRGGAGVRIRPFAVLIILFIILRVISSVYQATTNHIEVPTPPAPTGGPVIIGGKNEESTMPGDISDAWHVVFNELGEWRSNNPRVSLMDLSCEELKDFLEETGWHDVTITEDDDVRIVEAFNQQENSLATGSINSESVTLSVTWISDDKMPEEEIKTAWEQMLPDDAGIYPGMPVESTMISEEMLQAVRDYGAQDDYGSIHESWVTADGLFISLFEYEDSGWDLYLNGENTYIQIHSDDENKYIYSMAVEGESNPRFW